MPQELTGDLLVNIHSGNGLVSSDNKTFTEPVLTQISVTRPQWVKYLSGIAVLHFCIPSVEVLTSLRLNIAPCYKDPAIFIQN